MYLSTWVLKTSKYRDCTASLGETASLLDHLQGIFFSLYPAWISLFFKLCLFSFILPPYTTVKTLAASPQHSLCKHWRAIARATPRGVSSTPSTHKEVLQTLIILVDLQLTSLVYHYLSFISCLESSMQERRLRTRFPSPVKVKLLGNSSGNSNFWRSSHSEAAENFTQSFLVHVQSLNYHGFSKEMALLLKV